MFPSTTVLLILIDEHIKVTVGGADLLSSVINHKNSKMAQRDDIINIVTVKAEAIENVIEILVMESVMDGGNGENS